MVKTILWLALYVYVLHPTRPSLSRDDNNLTRAVVV